MHTLAAPKAATELTSDPIFVADTGVFAERLPAGIPPVRDALLANPNNVLKVPAVVRSELLNPNTLPTTRQAQANRLAGQPGDALVQSISDAPALRVVAAEIALNRNIATQLGRHFGQNDLILALTAGEQQLPLLTTNLALARQISARCGVLGNIPVIVLLPGMNQIALVNLLNAISEPFRTNAFAGGRTP